MPATKPAPTRRIRIHGKPRNPINEDLIAQALLIIARDLTNEHTHHVRPRERDEEP